MSILNAPFHGEARASVALVACVLLGLSCSDGDFYTDPDKGVGGKDYTGVEAAILDGSASSLPDGYQLYKCSNIGQACNAHDSCAINPICGPDGLCRPSLLQDCNDKLPCTTDTCLGSGMCGNTPKPGMCKLAVRVPKGVTCGQAQSDAGVKLDIGVANDAGVSPGQKETIFCCFSQGDRNPADNCSQCNPPASGDFSGGGSSATAWSPANGGYCDDGDACTQNDYCKNGTCQGTSYASKCSDGVSCTLDKCDGNGGCIPGHPLKTGWCLINNKCYKDGAAHPSGQCLACVSVKNPADWTSVSNTCLIGGKCYVKGSPHPLGCAKCDPALSLTAWSVSGSTHCLINDKCIAAGAKDTVGCASCQPNVNRYAYSPLPGMCKIDGKCYSTNDKHPEGCAICNSKVSTEKWTVTGSSHCLVNNKCYVSGTKDPTPGSCASCQPGVTKYDFSADAGFCKIQGVCIKSGTNHPKGCASCIPAKNKANWTPNTAKDCILNYQCATMCGSTCADTSFNNAHCGGCFKQCPAGLSCGAGKCTSCVPGSKTFSYTGSVQTFTIPPGCNLMRIEVKGAGGGNGGTRYGGAGGLMEGKVTLQSGMAYKIVVGGRGNPPTYSRSAPGGGGFSGVLNSSGNHVISAGGGGGSGGSNGGGAGGTGGGGAGSNGACGTGAKGGAGGITSTTPGGGLGGKGASTGGTGTSSGGGNGGAGKSNWAAGGGGGGYGSAAGKGGIQYSVSGYGGAGGLGGGGGGGGGGYGSTNSRMSAGGGGGGGHRGGEGGTMPTGCSVAGGGGGGGGSNHANSASVQVLKNVKGGGAAKYTHGSVTLTWPFK